MINNLPDHKPIAVGVVEAYLQEKIEEFETTPVYEKYLQIEQMIEKYMTKFGDQPDNESNAGVEEETYDHSDSDSKKRLQIHQMTNKKTKDYDLILLWSPSDIVGLYEYIH